METPLTVRHWCSRVVACSSCYGHGWDADCLLGPPKHYGDLRGSWAPLQPRGTQEWVELEFEEPLHIVRLDLYETFNPGHLSAVSALSEETGDFEVLWDASLQQSEAGAGEGPLVVPRQLPAQSRIFSPPQVMCPFPTSRVQLHFDCRQTASWVELDAVEVVGLRPPLVFCPQTVACFPPSLRQAAHAFSVCMDRRGLPRELTAEIIMRAYQQSSPLSFVAVSYDQPEIERRRLYGGLRCGFSAAECAWVCRGTEHGCVGGPVLGLGVFTSSSNPCSAAVHSGVMALPSAGGSFVLTPVSVSQVAPLLQTLAVSSNGVDAKPFPVSGATSGFVVSPKVGEPASPCGKKGPAWFCAGVSNGCRGQGAVFGSRFYRSDSCVCSAALHSGAIGVAGGLFMMVRGGESLLNSRWCGSWSNGVTSLSSESPARGFAVVPLIQAPPPTSPSVV